MTLHQVVDGVGGRVPAQTEQKAMWGQGLPGSEVTSLLGLCVTSTALNGGARWTRCNCSRPSPWTCGLSAGESFQRMELQKEDLGSDVRDAVFVRDRI
ncbi:hypothetical protein INR49_028456 [Caranx melampygus]|nr:hypothetical protein INR49_028456 [Caranx melampygus]